MISRDPKTDLLHFSKKSDKSTGQVKRDKCRRVFRRICTAESLEARLLFSTAIVAQAATEGAFQPYGLADIEVGNTRKIATPNALDARHARAAIKVTPFSSITIHGKFDASAATVARFTAASGYTMEAPVFAPTSKKVKVVVPPLLDPSTETEISGAASVTIVQTEAGTDVDKGVENLLISEPKPVRGSPGATTLAALKSVQATTQQAINSLPAGSDSTALNQQLQQINAEIVDVSAIVSGSATQIDYGSVGPTPLTLTASALQQSDEVAYAAGFRPAKSVKAGAAHRSAQSSLNKLSIAQLCGLGSIGATGILAGGLMVGWATGFIPLAVAGSTVFDVSSYLGLTIAGTLAVAGGSAEVAASLAHQDPLAKEGAALFSAGLQGLAQSAESFAIGKTLGDAAGKTFDLLMFVKDCVDDGVALQQGSGSESNVNATGEFGGQIVNGSLAENLVITLTDTNGTLTGTFQIYIDGQGAPQRSITGTQTGTHLDFTTTIPSSGVSSHYSAIITADGNSIAGTNDTGATISVTRLGT